MKRGRKKGEGFFKRCKLCGKVILDNNANRETQYYYYIDKFRYCSECAYWTEMIEHPKPNTEVIDGRMVKFMPFVENAQVQDLLGGKGVTRYILKRDGSVAKSNDIWNIGAIPPQFQDKLRTTAWWIPKNIYNSLSRNPFRCQSKFCLDRYHCLRFEILKEKTPFNLPPPTWVAGNEPCKYFINIMKVKNYEQYIDDFINKFNK